MPEPATFQRTVAEGIELRLFDFADAEAIFHEVERNRAWLREWLPWVDATHSAADIREFLVRVRTQFECQQGPQCGIWVDGAFSGSVGCHPIDWSNKHCSIGYWISEHLRGRGIVTKCCVSLLDYLFGELGLHRVAIQCGVGNRRSCAIPERLGFTREGIAREAEWVNDRWVDLVVWSMLAGDWAKR